MPILGLNTQAYLFHVVSRDEGGDMTYGQAIPIKISMMNSKDLIQISPIRSEASASHGRVDEQTGNLVGLFPPTCGVIKGDRVDSLGTSMEVVEILPREDLWGRLNHFEVTLRNLSNVQTTPYVPKRIF